MKKVLKSKPNQDENLRKLKELILNGDVFKVENGKYIKEVILDEKDKFRQRY